MKLLWSSDNPILSTGYAMVTRNLLNRFKQANIETHCFGHQSMVGNTIHYGKIGNNYLDFPIYNPIFFQENWGNKGSLVYWNNIIKPDIQAFLCDSFMIKHMFDPKYEKDKDKKIVEYTEASKLVGKKLFYFPFDSQEVYEDAKPAIEGMDILVAMSKSSHHTLKKDMGKDSFYIPHGVNTHIFRPLPDSIIQPLRKQNGWDKDTFVIGCVARNQTRKMLTRLIDAFNIFQKGKDNVILFFHCHPNTPEGYNMASYSNKLGLKKKVIYSGLVSPYATVSESQVNLIYNMMDVHVLPTSGEGFGLPIIESMSCGVPNICTDYTTARELIRNHGEVARVNDFVNGGWNSQRALVDVEDLAKKISKLWWDKKLRQKYSEAGRKFILKNHTWEKCTRAWLELFEFGEIKEKFL